jgi:tungstate transport system substrate-binding protein
LNVAIFVSFQAFSARKRFILATTTSTYETGLLDHILEPFEEKFRIKIHIISVGTGKAIKLAENGDADVILVHDRVAEELFVNQGFGVNKRDVMYNDFIILGPENDPAEIKGLTEPVKAFTKIYNSEYIFISRGDNSGTHKKEKFIWSKTGNNPNSKVNTWYLETGQGQALTLQVADEKNGYIFIDRGTYLFHKQNIRLKVLVEGGEELLNFYSIIAVSPYIHKHVNFEMAMALITWMTSPECQKMIADYKINGEILFHQNATKDVTRISE